MTSTTFDTTTDPKEFRIEKEIGVGGFGKVYHLTHVPTGLQLAGKMINPKLLTEDAKKSLMHEINLMKQFDSPYTIQYYGTINYDGHLMILMDFCDLGSIRDLMDYRDEVLTEEQIAFVLRDTLAALDLFHTKHQMIHRDIKAGNILFNSKCEVKITDFGVSRQFDENAKTMSTTSVLGTPFWMAPEVIQGEKSSFPCDIWSVGATAIEMAEGGPPYCEFPAPQAMLEISTNGFIGFRNNGYFSEAFADFVFKCMDKDPKRRPTARDLLSHPFIEQTKRLDRREVFGDLPMTTIDFAKLLEMGEEEEDQEEFDQDTAQVIPPEVAPPPPPEEEPAKEEGAPAQQQGLPQVPKVAVRQRGKTKVKVTKRIVGYTTKFLKPVEKGVTPKDIYKERAEMMFKDEQKMAQKNQAAAPEAQQPASGSATNTGAAPAPAGQDNVAKLVDVAKKNPLIVVGAVLVIVFGFQKGLVILALLFAAYAFMQKKKDKTD